MGQYYILEGKEPVLADMMTWGKWFQDNDRSVAMTKLPGDISVSTVFLGIDHNWGEGSPHLFETMVFGGDDDGYCERTSTWAMAEKNHEYVVSRQNKG